MAVGVKQGAVIAKGGNQLFIYQVDPSTFAGVTLTVGTYLFNLSFIGDSNLEQSTDEQVSEYEDGDEITVGYTYKVMFDATLKQSDGDLITLLAETVKGQTYLLGKYTGYVNLTYQWVYMIVKIKPQFKISRPGGDASMKMEAKAVKLNAAVTYSAATMASIGSLLTLSNYPTTTLTIGISKRFAIMESGVIV